MLGRLVLATCVALAAREAAAQWRPPTDRSLTASLLAAALPGPSAPVWLLDDSAKAASEIRWDVAWGGVMRHDLAGTAQSLVVGVREENQQRDTTAGAHAVIVGARAALRTGPGAQRNPVSAIEGYLGARSLSYVGVTGWPDVGFDVVVGWGGFGEDTRASFGLRLPVELVREGAGVRVALLATPSIAWGHLRLRECVDNGPGDNCGALGIQVAAGQPRYLLGGGASLTSLRTRLSASVGVQRLFAPGERGRAWVGLAWTP